MSMIVSVDGAELHYTTRGSGPVCLVPTLMGTKPYERQLAGPLAEHLTLVFVDVRGGGESTGDAGDLTFDRLAADLEAVREQLGTARVAVLGHSIVGVLALEYGRRCPGAVSHVITVGTPPRGDMAWLAGVARQFFEQDASAERKHQWQDNLAKLPPGTPLEQSFPAQAPLRFYDAQTDLLPLYRDSVFKPALVGHVLGPLTQDWDVTHAADSLRVPILLAHGRYDYTVPHSLWDGLAEKLPSATRHVFERSGHQPFLEEPDEFAAVVRDWLHHAAGPGATRT